MDARGRTRRTRTLVGAVITAAALIGTAAAPPGSAAGRAADSPGVGLRSSFAFDSDGWTAAESGDPTFWASTGGNPGGNMAAQRGTGAATGLASPPEWAGDRSGLLGGTLSFDVKLSPGAATTNLEVFLNSDDSEVPAIYKVIPDSGGAIPGWTRYTLRVAPKRGWQVDAGTGARRADFVAALSSLTSITISGATTNTSDTLYLDNVRAASDVDVTVSLGYRDNRFFGKLRPAGGCAAERPVTVYRQRPGPDTKVGADVTDRRGEWALNKRNAVDGLYYATVPGGFKIDGGSCSAARSRTLTLD